MLNIGFFFITVYTYCMYEIEIKAWVRNREKTVERLNSFAEYQCSINKNDVYYKFPVKNEGKKVSFRIRSEEIVKNGKKTSETVFTYKKKKVQLVEDAFGQPQNIEVNQENEFSLSDPAPLVLMAEDLGAEVSLRKTKITECWHLETECGTANIELCTVPPLGDFLEIEIVTDKNDADFVQKIRQIEENIFVRCGIELSEIEERFYSQLLKEAGSSDTNVQ